MNEQKHFFINVLDDLRLKCDSISNYNYIKSAGLLRQLLIDENPLVDIINREYREKITFEVRRVLPNSQEKIIANDGTPLIVMASMHLILPSNNDFDTEFINKDKFLKFVVFEIEGHKVNILQILKLNANVKGGVHFEKQKTLTFDEYLLERANSTFNMVGNITGGAYAIHEVGKVTLKALEKLEKRVRVDLKI